MSKFLALFKNHLEFLRTHRGAVSRHGDRYEIVSEKAAFTYLVAGKDSVLEEIHRFPLVHTAPWTSDENLKGVEAAGFQKQAGLSYMELKNLSEKSNSLPNLLARVVAGPVGMEVFTEIQCRSFCEDPKVYAEWKPFIRDGNFRNIENPEQNFYIASSGVIDAGVMLTVRTGAVGGIYAVGTLPDMRKRGISSFLLRRAIKDLFAKGVERITLQVQRGSFAESFYLKLGFEVAFCVEVWAQAARS